MFSLKLERSSTAIFLIVYKNGTFCWPKLFAPPSPQTEILDPPLQSAAVDFSSCRGRLSLDRELLVSAASWAKAVVCRFALQNRLLIIPDRRRRKLVWILNLGAWFHRNHENKLKGSQFASGAVGSWKSEKKIFPLKSNLVFEVSAVEASPQTCVLTNTCTVLSRWFVIA